MVDEKKLISIAQLFMIIQAIGIIIYHYYNEHIIGFLLLVSPFMYIALIILYLGLKDLWKR